MAFYLWMAYSRLSHLKVLVFYDQLIILPVPKTFIYQPQIRRFDLRNGDKVSGKVRPPKENERYYGLLHVDAVNDDDPESAKERIHFPGLTALYPDRFMKLERKNN